MLVIYIIETFWFSSLQVQGKYKRFWGSDQWSVKIDFSYELAKTIRFEYLLVEFKNDKNGLFNSFEVTDLCSCVNLMMKFAEGFGITVFDQRLVNFMEEYFNEHGVKVEAKAIRRCLKKKELDEKIDVKVKKLTIVDKTFTDILEYNPKDLIVDFTDFYKDESWIIGEKEQLFFPIVSNYSYQLAKKKKEENNQITIENNYNGQLDIFMSLVNDKEDKLSNITISQVILPEFKPISVNASLIAPDGTVLGVFQPLEIQQGEQGLKIVWKVNELKINHKVEIEFVLLQRIPFKLKLQTNEGLKNYIRYFDISSSEKNQFSIDLPALMESQFTKTSIESITALFPIEFETQSILYLYPHYILKMIDLGFFQRITFSEPFIETLFYDQIKLEGNILPVLTLYESFIPQTGSKLIKKIFRNHSYTNPIVMYNLETSSSHSFEITEEYPNSVNVNLFTLGNQYLHEKTVSTSEQNKNLTFYLDATNDTILFSLSASNIAFDLEKTLIDVKDTILNDDYEIFQAINVESIVDQTNKNYLDFKNFKIKSDTESNKLRLRSFSLKINEQEKELASNGFNQSELDKAFETLKQTESLAALKDKIKAGYTSSFADNTSEEGTLTGESSTSSSGVLDSTETDRKGTIIINADESSAEDKAEIDELDSFINDFGGETDQSTEIPLENAEEQMQELEKISQESSNYDETAQQEPEAAESPVVESQATTPQIAEPETSEQEKNITQGTQPIQPVIEEQIEEPPKEEKTEAIPKQIPKKKGKKSRKKQVEEVVVKEAPSLEINVIFEKFVTKQQIQHEILDSDDKVIFMDKDGKVLNKSEEKVRPDKTFFKIPRDDRFLILILNPNENLAAHIYGRWKPKDPITYKVLLSQTKGLWHVRIQLLESGNTYDLDFKLE